MCRKYSHVHFKPISHDFHQMPGSSCPPKKQSTTVFSSCHFLVYRSPYYDPSDFFFFKFLFFPGKIFQTIQLILRQKPFNIFDLSCFFLSLFEFYCTSFVLRCLAALLFMHQRLICNSRMRCLFSIQPLAIGYQPA